jgi:hypothetical protein
MNNVPFMGQDDLIILLIIGICIAMFIFLTITNAVRSKFEGENEDEEI